MAKQYVVDTCVFMSDLSKLKNPELYVVTSHVLRELRNHQKGSSSERAFHARKAIRYIEANMDTLFFDTWDYDSILDGLDGEEIDNKLLQCCLENQYGIITNDVLLKIKAKAFGIEQRKLSEVHENDDYTGFKEVSLEDELLELIYTNQYDWDVNHYNLLPNQYLIIKDRFGTTAEKRRWTGTTHVPLKLPPKKVVVGQNDLQDIALDLLHNKSIPIKFIVGTYGSGKTYLSIKVGLDYILSRTDGYSKLMMVRNPLGSGEAIGFLKGDKAQKTDDFFKPIIQHLEGGEQEAYLLETRGQLLREIPYFMKGLSLEETFVLVDEAEDLNKKLIKLLGTRIGKNSCIVFSGDIEQAEDKYMHDNGLLYAIEALKGHPLVGIVVLQEDIRSEASKVFAHI